MLDREIAALFSLDAFRRLAANEPINLPQYHFITDALIRADVPFDASFVSGSRKEAAAIQLTIHLNPTATLVFVVSLSPGSTVFSPSP